MSNIPFTPDEIQDQLIRTQLAKDEVICWIGQEPRGHYLTNRIVGIIASVLIGLFAGFFVIVMVVMNPNIFQGSIQSLLPVLIPLGIFGFAVYSLVRSIQALVKGRPALYVITDQRALLIEQGTALEVKAYGPEAINTMQITKHKNGMGKIIFEREVSWTRDSEGRSQRRVVEIGFFGVPAVDEVCHHLQQIARPQPSLTLGGEALDSNRTPAATCSEFFALETSALHEYLYKLSMVGRQVCGARIAGSFSSVGLQHMGEVSGYGFLFSPLANQIAKGEQKREMQYQALDPLSPEFLAVNKANFRYGSLETDHVVVTEEYKTLESGYNASGRLEIHLRDGKLRKLWLTRNANPAAVAELFRTNGIRVEEHSLSAQALAAR